MKKWNEKQAELTNEAEDDNTSPEEFSDLSRMACLLCQRKFKSEKELRRHENLSDLHKVGPPSRFDIMSFSAICTSYFMILTM